MADDKPPEKPLDQSGIDALADELLKMGSFGDVAGSSQNPPPSNAAPFTPDLAELEALLKQATFDDASTSVAAAKNAVDDITAQIFAEADAAERAQQTQRPTPALSPGMGIQMPVQSNAPLPSTMPFDLPAFQQAISDAQASSIDLLRDVDLNVKIELGRSRMLVEDVLKLSEGSVVELDKLAGDPVDVFVNDRLVARGEVLVLNDNFCVRVNEIVATAREEV